MNAYTRMGKVFTESAKKDPAAMLQRIVEAKATVLKAAKELNMAPADFPMEMEIIDLMERSLAKALMMRAGF